jgi:septation ring formation regulator EzrA
MLFTPWRNEQADLMGNYSSFEEHYEPRRDEISEQMQQYAICSEDLNEIQHHLQECDDDAYDPCRIRHIYDLFYTYFFSI